MAQEKEKGSRTWAEKNVPNLFGFGVFAMLGLISAIMILYG